MANAGGARECNLALSAGPPSAVALGTEQDSARYCEVFTRMSYQTPDDAPAPDRGIGCRAVRGVLPGLDDMPFPAPVSAPGTVATPESASASHAQPASTLSPRVRRALLEVFLM